MKKLDRQGLIVVALHTIVFLNLALELLLL
jgi:hypothetical protein